MAKKVIATHTTGVLKSTAARDVLQALQIGGRFAVLDLALLVSALLLIFTDATIFFFHLTFLLLTVGAFYWRYPAFVLRAAIWVTVATLVLLFSVLAGNTRPAELVEIPMLIAILILVFAIARYRARAEEATVEALEDARQRQAEVSALLESSRAVLAYPEFESAARSIFDSCKRLTGATAGYVALLTQDGTANEVLFLDSGGTVCTVDPALPMPIRGLRDEVYRNGKTVYENDFSGSEWTTFLPEGHVDLDNVLFTPLKVQDVAVGLLGLANKPGGFTQNDARLAAAFAELASIALFNSRTIESLHNSEERFRSVAETASEAIITIDSRGNIVFWNKAATTIFGYGQDEAIGQPVSLIMPERFQSAHQNGMEQVVSTGESRILGTTVEMVGLRRDGSEFPVELSLSTWQVREERFFTGIIQEITERKRVEEEIQSLARFPSENRNAVLRVSRDSTILYANKAAAPLLALWASQVGQKLPDTWRQLVADAYSSGVGPTIEVASGERVFSVDFVPVAEADYVNLYGRDITERVRAEVLLRDQNQFITTVFESLGHPFYVVDAHDYTVQMANSATALEDLPHGITCHALTHGRTAPCGDREHPCTLEEIKKTGKPVVVEHTHYDRDGKRGVYEVHGHPIFDDEGKVKQIIEYTLDVTDRKGMEEALRAARDELELRVEERTAALATANQALQAEIAERKQTEETLRSSEERYRRLVELSFEAIAIHSQGRLVYVNPAAVELLGGSSLKQFVGKPIRDFVHPDYWNMAQVRVQQVGEEGKGAPLVEERLIRLDGTSVEVEVASVPITYHGQPAVQSVMRDVSQRKRAEAERERERARLARHLHDTLGHSLGYLHLKLDQLIGEDALATGEGVRGELAQMRDVADDAYEVVRGMLAASLPSNATDLATALLVQARSVGQRGEFKVLLTSEGQPRSLSPIVQQQLLYLVQEALINVERHADARQVNIRLVWGEDSLTLSLSDDGKGFDPEGVRSDRHFGLAIMHERAREMNGQLTLSSRPDRGTNLVLRVPLPSASQAPRSMLLVRDGDL